jgi:hypothetical protein
MHGVDTSHKIDFNLNGFGLQLSQGLYRQEAAGKTGLACLMNGEDGHSMMINLSGGKTDQSGVFGYGKRFACNWLEPHNCLPTAIGRNIFSRLSSDSSNYLYMSNDQARRYETKLAKKIAINKSKADPVRVRALGPHTRFRIHFKRGIMKMVKQKPGMFGIPPELIAPHCHKRTGYRQLKRCSGVLQDHVNARADHRSGLGYVYGAKMVSGNFTSGGPSERVDLTMAKALANLPQRDLRFNQSPPHFTHDFIATIPFHRIVPCFQHLPHNVVKLLPLLLAQLVHHYHKSEGLRSLGRDNPLRMSPLWNDPEWITYRHTLFDNLVGAGYNFGTVPAVDLRDLDTDKFVCQQQSLKNNAALLQAGAAFMRQSGLDASYVDECFQETVNLMCEVTGRALGQEPFRQPTNHVNNNMVAICPVKPSVSTLTPIIRQPQSIGNPQLQGFRVLAQAPGAFVMPVSLQCRFAFCRMHSKGTDKLGLWRGNNAAMIDNKIVGKERKRQRELFNKVIAVCKMILGSNSFADVDKIGTDLAWVRCCGKVQRIWGFDLLLQGSAAIRSVDNIMHGKDTKLSQQQCREFVRKCETSSWNCVHTEQAMVEEGAVLNISEDVDGDSEDDLKNISADLNAGCNDDVSDSPRANEFNLSLDAKDCFVCDRCTPMRLFPEWSKYTEHAKTHRVERKYFFIKSEVRMVLGTKSNKDVKTSSYCAVGDPYFKRYSAEETRVHLRQGILYRHILRQNDQIRLFYSEDQPSLLATILDPQIQCLKKAHMVKVLLLGHPRIEFQCPVTSILEIVDQPGSSGKVGTPLSPSTAKRTNAPASAASPRLFSAASTLSNHGTVSKGLVPKTLFPAVTRHMVSSFRCASVATAKRPGIPINAPSIVATPLSSSAASPSSKVGLVLTNRLRKPFGSICTGVLAADLPAGCAIAWQPVCKSHTQLAPGVNIMLRGVSEYRTWYALPKLVPPPALSIGTTNVNAGFPVFEHRGALFIVNDYGMHFSSIYPPWIQNVLHAFRLDESCRCFYLVLGIALNYDPFMLQCLFRSHADLLSVNQAYIFDNLRDEDHARHHCMTEFEELVNVNPPDKYFDSCLLRYFWPEELETIRIVVIATRRQSSHETIFHSASWTPTSAGAQTIYMKLESDHYTHLTLVRGALTHETSTWLCHEICPQMRCPSINSLVFDTAEDNESYLASALSGQLPSGDEVSNIWQQVTHDAGLEADPISGKWVKGIPAGVDCSDYNQHGSLKAVSWEVVRNSLLSAFLSDQPVKARRSRVLSPIKSPCQGAQQLTGEVPLVFLDVGSEAGTGLLKMLHDSRITHAAGIELQPAWFALSVRLFKALREAFVTHGYRMPQISLFRSCMLAQKPELEYLYANASIVWLNNCVMDKAPYFKMFKKDVNGLERNITRAPLTNLSNNDPARSSLSSNAAFHFSKQFHHSTCIAVFAPEYFSNVYKYSYVKRLTVDATWGVWDPLSVSIFTHKQHVTVARGNSLQCVSYHDACFWHRSMELWGHSSQTAFNNLKQVEWHTVIKRPVILDRDGRVVCSDEPDEARDRFEIVANERVSSLEAVLSNGWKNKLLSLQSAATLQPRHLLDSSTMLQYMRLLQTHFPSVSFCSNMMYKWKELHNIRRPADLLKFAQNYMRIQQCNQLIFTLNSGIHWQAFKIDLKEKYIASMCSLKDPLISTAVQILSVLSSIVPGASSFKHISVPVPHQQNCADCGPLCCMFMLFLAQTDVTSSTELQYETKTTALAIRMRIFADLANDKLTTIEQTSLKRPKP